MHYIAYSIFLAQVEFVLHTNQEAYKVTFTVTVLPTSRQHPWRTQEDEGPTAPRTDGKTPSCRKLREQTRWTDMAAFLSLSENFSTAETTSILLYYLTQIIQPSFPKNLKMLTKNIQLHKRISFSIFFLLDRNLHTYYLKNLESQQLRIAGSWIKNIFYCLKTHFGQLRLKISTAFYPTQCPHQWDLNDLMFLPRGWVRPARNTSWNPQRHQRQNSLQNKISALASGLSRPLSWQAGQQSNLRWGHQPISTWVFGTRDHFSHLYVFLPQRPVTAAPCQHCSTGHEIKLPSRFPAQLVHVGSTTDSRI